MINRRSPAAAGSMTTGTIHTGEEKQQ